MLCIDTEVWISETKSYSAFLIFAKMLLNIQVLVYFIIEVLS